VGINPRGYNIIMWQRVGYNKLIGSGKIILNLGVSAFRHDKNGGNGCIESEFGSAWRGSTIKTGSRVGYSKDFRGSHIGRAAPHGGRRSSAP
jgi:hypothetical protein